jgi:WD40 repeat protein/serine/threonine protein kinase
MSEPTIDRDPFELVAESFLARYRAGERPGVEEYAARYPDLADQIRELLPALLVVERDLSLDDVSKWNGAQPAPGTSPDNDRRLGDYRILREIGRGGMGVVYEAEQMSLGRRVALKVLPRQVAGDRESLERFRREAKSAARLHHTNIVPVFEVGFEGEVAYYAMQFIQGQGLDEVIDELAHLRDPNLSLVAASLVSGLFTAGDAVHSRNMSPDTTERSTRHTSRPSDFVMPDRERKGPRATKAAGTSAVLPDGGQLSSSHLSGRKTPYFRSVAQIGRQAAQGLAYAHVSGIVHRDIKPSNLLLDHAGIVWITDFGLAKGDDDGLTHTGDILGTIRYMAPERFRGEGDARADVYALGLTLYELLTLRPAFGEPDRLKLSEQIKNEDPPPPRLIDGQVPRDLETIVLHAIDKDLNARYQSAEAIAEDLRRFLADEPILARQVSTPERYARWARRNPAVATLGAVLSAVLMMATVGSLLMVARFANLADEANNSATKEHAARIDADKASEAAEAARAAALAETYRAMLSEVKALRAGHQLGWRDEALANLARLAVMPTPRRDLVELRSEAVATIGEFGVKEVARFEVSGRSAYTLDFSSDSRSLAAASEDGSLDLWDIPARKKLGKLPERSKIGWAVEVDGLVQFLPDGELVFISSKKAVTFLQASGRPSARMPINRAPADALKLSLDRERRRLAVGWKDGRIDIHDAATGSLQRSIAWTQPWDFALSPDGQSLAVQTFRGPVQLVSISGQGAPFRLGRTSGYFPALAFNPGGETIAGVEGRNVGIWSLKSKQELLVLSGHKEEVTAITFSPDGSLIATTCGDSMTRIWDAREGRALAVLPGPWYMRRLAFSPDGQYLAASADPGPICLYQIQGRRERRTLVGHEFGTLSLAFHPRLPRVASSSDDHTLIVWDTIVDRPLHRWVAEVGQKGLAFSPDGSYLACSTSSGSVGNSNGVQLNANLLRLLNAEDGTERRRFSGHQSSVRSVAFDPKGTRLASGDFKGAVILWDVASGRMLRREVVVSSPVESVVFVHGGRRLLFGLYVGEIALLDLEHADPPRTVRVPDGFTDLVVDERTNRITIGDSRGALIALSLPDLEVVHRLSGAHDQSIVCLALSPDGQLLATSGMDRRVVLRDASTLQAVATFPSWTGVVRDLSFDSTGRWLGFAGSDSDVGLWDLKMFHDELAALGLAWDQPAPAVRSTSDLDTAQERSAPQVPKSD